MTFESLLNDDRREIKRNRQVYESYRHFSAPNEIGDRFEHTPHAGPGALRGIPASPGVTHGTARVAATVDEAMSAAAGEILVCPFTDPGWTPVLSRVGGVVTENGGMLSHAAVICRELGIPAVLGIADACRRIPSGSLIRLDGGTGVVEPDLKT